MWHELHRKNQRHMKKSTVEDVNDVWKVFRARREKSGENWYGGGGYARSNSFSKHFAQHCRNLTTSNETRARVKELVEPTILWQGTQILCMKSAVTLSCKLCMQERKAINTAWRRKRNSIMNDCSDIFGCCKCKTIFHRFKRKNARDTEYGCKSQEKVTEPTAPEEYPFVLVWFKSWWVAFEIYWAIENLVKQ